jgi:acetylornithine deacetylase/succinyl-diaminopimelate desuccinylase-like protein
MDEQARQAASDAVTASDVVQLAKDLIDIPSPTGEELACARFLHGYLEQSGVEVRLQEVEPGRSNVVAIVRGEGDGPTLMLNGHLDTTFYGDERQDYPLLGVPRPNDRPQAFEVDGGIYGLGAYNMKGGVASAFTALRALKAAGVRLRGHVMASGVVGESEKAPVRGALCTYEGPAYRGAGYGTRFLVAQCPPVDFAIVAEPSNLYVCNAQAGYLYVKIVVWGRPAYLGDLRHPGEGHDAIDDAAEVVRAIREWAPGYAARHTYDSGMGAVEPAVTVGAIEAGWPFFPSFVPGVGHIYVNLRVTPAMTGGQALAELDRRLRALAADRPSLRYDLDVFGSNLPSTVTPAGSLLCRTAVELMEERLGFPTRPFAPGEANPSNDTNVFRRHGIPAIKCGPTARTEPNGPQMTRLHGPHVYRDDLVQAARFYVQMAFELCGRSRSEIEAMGA